jgi:hypothetical protein
MLGTAWGRVSGAVFCPHGNAISAACDFGPQVGRGAHTLCRREAPGREKKWFVTDRIIFKNQEAGTRNVLA